MLTYILSKTFINVDVMGFKIRWLTWEQRKLEDITRRYDNLRVPVTASKRKHGDIPYYGANGIQDFVSGYTHDGEFILVAEDGARDPKNYPVNYVNGKIWVNNHAHVLQGIQGLANNLFLLNGIKKINIAAYLVGGSRAKLNAETLMQLSIKLPSIHEQEKLGQLFQSLDKTITLHEEQHRQLEQLKKALLQKMFADETGYPALRFKRFSTAWEQHKLSKLTTKIGTGKSKYKLQDNGRYPILGSTSVIGYDNNFDYTGDFILTARVGANAGNLYRFSGSVKITDNTVFIKSKYNKFLYYYLQKYDLKKLSFGTGQPLVKASDLKNLKILKPRLDEEIYRISKLLLSVDNLITLHQHKIHNLKRLKRALLQKMFV